MISVLDALQRIWSGGLMLCSIAAYGAGIRYFDVARSYGYAERFLASWLTSRGLAPGRVAVGSKWGYTYVGEWRPDATVHEVKDHSLDALRRQFEDSKKTLGDHLCLYQIHSATTDTGVLTDASVAAELAALAETGMAVGLSLSGPGQRDALAMALEVEVGGTNPFSCVQATYNLLEPSVGGALKEAHEAGLGVIVKEVFANGRLAPEPELHARLEKRTPLDRVARSHGVSVDALALSWVLAHDFVDVALSGAVTEAQLESNLSGLDLNLDDEALSALAGLAEPPDAYWGTRMELAWN